MINELQSLADTLCEISAQLKKVASTPQVEVEQQPKNKFLTLTQASEFLGISKAALYAMVSRGLIPYYKPGKILYFLEEELLLWIASKRMKSVDEIVSEAAAASLKRHEKKGYRRH